MHGDASLRMRVSSSDVFMLVCLRVLEQSAEGDMLQRLVTCLLKPGHGSEMQHCSTLESSCCHRRTARRD